ncbi:glycosyl hydrolase family 3 N terminal domain protein [Mycobacterium xenopi 4042]|uniref:beta-N-acetylhexosaminidase n=1 Tax=Mycobacterium xenopi 4042 TaxID=1299334 RepID=X7ZB06_MYCXE|nr:glycosyl hydrolase family 3 N terminal domain protein [Mycobacterium xenopi 4042]
MLAQTKTADEVYTVALDRGRKMRTLGITVDFAPVVDVSDAPADTVIGDRSFGSDPAVVTAYAGAYARGLRDAGCCRCSSTFQGMGMALATRIPARSPPLRLASCNATTWCRIGRWSPPTRSGS